MIWLFSNNVWRTFGSRLLETFFVDQNLRFDFGYGWNDVKLVCRFWKEEYQQEYLQAFADKHELSHVTDEAGERKLIKKVMKVFLDNYHPRTYYLADGTKETWNKPSDTLESWKAKDQKQKRLHTTDCDDYAILIYSLLRYLGVGVDRLWLCFMKTIGEWHLNVMYISENTPYAVEGTYRPESAYREFLRTPYFNLTYRTVDGDRLYYEGVRWRFNENSVQRWGKKLNEV